ncbi:MAG: dTMP kinase [Candidatus Marinimicrobia bacterium]|nr:dTMP kinase [Candidatus Neomarinimicrobiota bacterium]
MIQMSTSKGKFITFEGIDGCGKSTQVKKLVEFFNKTKKTAIFVREPGGTQISEEIREILLNRHLEDISDRTEALLMTGSRSQLTHEIIIPNLNKGLHVVADRYSDSTLAYQGGGRQIDIEWLIRLNQFATYDIEPNVTFYIDVLPEEALKRKNQEKDRIEMAGIELQSRVRNAYLEIAKRFQSRYLIIDGHDSIDNIHDIIISHIKQRKYL